MLPIKVSGDIFYTKMCIKNFKNLKTIEFFQFSLYTYKCMKNIYYILFTFLKVNIDILERKRYFFSMHIIQIMESKKFLKELMGKKYIMKIRYCETISVI